MSTTTIQFSFLVDGVPTNATSVALRDPADTFGVRRTDTLAAVVAAGTAMANQSPGVYAHAFTDPEAGLTYNYWVEAVYDGATYRFERNQSGPGAASGQSYLDVTDADALAATVPALAAWSAATTDQKTRALRQATSDVDAAMAYQGRRYAADQALEFPRVAADGSSSPSAACCPPADGSTVWDWDPTAAAAVVPRDVRLAVLYQADSVLAGEREPRIAAQHDGVVYDLTGTLAESYKQTTGPGVRTGLARRAYTLMRKYRLRGGRLL